MNAALNFRMGFRNLWNHKKQHLFLFSALALCFSIISLMTFVSAGMSKNVYDASRIHYGGDVILTAFDKSSRQYNVVDHWNILEKIIGELPEAGELKMVKRSSLFKEGYVFFNGKSQLMKNITGLDVSSELTYLQHFNYLSGSAEAIQQLGSVALSAGVAESLGLRQGDNVTLKVTTRSGQINTGDFVVRAILDDDSILGYYRLFMNRADLNKLIGFQSEQYSILGLYLQHPEKASYYSHLIYKKLHALLPTGGEIQNRDQYYREMDRNWRELRYFVFPLSLYISEIDDLLGALDLVSYFLYFMMLCITLVSVLVSYSIIIHNRRRELAIFSAMGLKDREVEGILVNESILLLSISILSGFIFSLLLLFILQFFSFDWIPGFEIFLKQGRLSASWDIKRLLIDIGVIFMGVVPVVWLQVRKKTAIPVSVRLSGGEH